MIQALSLKDEKLKFPHLIHYYSDFLFKFLKKYHQDLNLNMSILDAGCGHGRNLNLLYNLGFRDLTGIDIIKRKNFKKYTYQELDLTKDSIKNKYDIVLCNFVLMFVDPKHQIKVIDKLLNSTNKYLLIETRQIQGEYSYTCYIQNFYNYIKSVNDVEILYYNKNKERLLIKKCQKQMDILDK